MSEQIVSLEKSLRFWEDACLLTNLLARSKQKQGEKIDFPYHGPFVHFREFRTYLLNSRQTFDMDKFCEKFVESKKPDKPNLLGDIAELPLELLLWTYSSKRVYHLTSNAQLLLNATSVSNINWDQVKFPFDSFAITLSEPIKGSTILNRLYDTIIITCYDTSYGCPFIEIRLLSNQIKEYEPIPDDEVKLMEKFLADRKYEKLDKRLRKYFQQLPHEVISPRFTLPLTEKNLKAKVTESIINLAQSFLAENKGTTFIEENMLPMPDEGNTAIRLIVGLCLLLTTVQAKDIKNHHFHYPRQKNASIQLPIFNGSEIFTVTTTRNLTPSEHEHYSEGLRNGGYTVSPHFRRGTWRFPPRQANNPDAQKTVWVQPSLVNAHLLAENQLPGGSINQL